MLKQVLSITLLTISCLSFAGKKETIEDRYNVDCKVLKNGFGYGNNKDYPVRKNGNTVNYQCISNIGDMCGSFFVDIKRVFLAGKTDKEKVIFPKGQKEKAEKVAQCNL